MTKEQKCIRMLVNHIDGLLTYSELVIDLSYLDIDVSENLPDNSEEIYPPLKTTLRQAVLQFKEENAANKS